MHVHTHVAEGMGIGYDAGLGFDAKANGPRPVAFPRGVAQPGSATGLGPVGRRFESCHPDWV